jgi:hypothetical protein
MDPRIHAYVRSFQPEAERPGSPRRPRLSPRRPSPRGEV